MHDMEAGRPPEIKRSRKPARPVKRELNQEMKSFAESTMNELLGWYGYEEVDLQEVSGAENRKPCVKRHVSVLRENSVPSAQVEGASSENEKHGEREAAKACAISDSASITSSTTSSSSEERESRDTHVIVPLIKPSAIEEVQNVMIVCVWCQREGVRRFSLLMGLQLKSFCSEKCFFACRRAHFKRNKANDSSCHGDESPGGKEEKESLPIPKMKTSANNKVCDWCKRLQPTHESLATGTGDERLHFCSSECVNQYKIDVFYREARAALTARQSTEDHAAEVKESKVKEGSPRSPRSPLLTPASWTSALKPMHLPKNPPASSSSSSAAAAAAAASEPISVCQRTSLCHSSISSSSSLPPLSSPSQERFTITRVTAPPPPPPQPQCPSLLRPLPSPLIIHPHTPHTLPSHTPPPPSHTRSPSQTLAATQTHSSLRLAHVRPPPVIPPFLMPPFPGAPMMHFPPGCPPVGSHMPTHPHAPQYVLPMPSLPPPFPQNTIIVPYPIFIPLPVPVPIPFPLLVPVEAHTPSHTSPATGGQAHAPLADQGDITLTGVCVKAENPSSPHTHTQAQAAAVAHSARSNTEEEEEEENDEDMEEERETEVEEEDDDNKVHDKNPMMNRQREEWRERWREREVIQSLTLIPPVTAETEAHGGAGEKETADESDWSSGRTHLCPQRQQRHAAETPHTLPTHSRHTPHTHSTDSPHTQCICTHYVCCAGTCRSKTSFTVTTHYTHQQLIYTLANSAKGGYLCCQSNCCHANRLLPQTVPTP
ncbi:sine oculis-binding protein homolog B-like [Clupea harengus]|uniref:Sine oculis-binding protein homolog B-like n=1 Tax=Clupea harengus TaxID=7950 RepID=A0A8M1KP87_CLUHA|nr:sine oculis-binding protein homolog B-like [Clupea harengus]